MDTELKKGQEKGFRDEKGNQKGVDNKERKEFQEKKKKTVNNSDGRKRTNLWLSGRVGGRDSRGVCD